MLQDNPITNFKIPLPHCMMKFVGRTIDSYVRWRFGAQNGLAKRADNAIVRATELRHEQVDAQVLGVRPIDLHIGKF